MSMPMAQAIAAAFGLPQLANVFYYGKEFGSKKQKLKGGEVEEEEYKPLSVTQPGAEPEQLVEQIEGRQKKEENPVDQVLRAVDDDNLSFDDLIRILRGQ